MKLTDLRLFVDIVDAGGLTAAADRRGVTQPAISRALRDMETRLQAQLLTRTGRGIELTPAGEAFLQFSAETLERFSETRKLILDQAGRLPRQIRLSVPLRLGRLLIPGLYRAFNDTMPETSLHVFEEPSHRAGELLAEDQLDAALTYRSGPRPDRNFVPIYNEHLFAVGNKHALGAADVPISGQNLSDLPLLLPSTGRYRELIETALRAAGHPLRIARELETAEGLLAFAAEGEGIAILPVSNVYQEVARQEVVARPITQPELSRVVGVQLNANMPKTTAALVLPAMRMAARNAASDADWRSPKR